MICGESTIDSGRTHIKHVDERTCVGADGRVALLNQSVNPEHGIIKVPAPRTVRGDCGSIGDSASDMHALKGIAVDDGKASDSVTNSLPGDAREAEKKSPQQASWLSLIAKGIYMALKLVAHVATGTFLYGINFSLLSWRRYSSVIPSRFADITQEILTLLLLSIFFACQILSLYARGRFITRNVSKRWKKILKQGMLVSIVVAILIMYNCTFGCDDYKDLAGEKLNFGIHCTCDALPLYMLTTLFIAHATVWVSNFASQRVKVAPTSIGGERRGPTSKVKSMLEIFIPVKPREKKAITGEINSRRLAIVK